MSDTRIRQECPPASHIRRVLHKLLLDPATATRVAVAFRPVLTSLVSESVEGLLEGRFDATALPEGVAVALVNLLSFAPHLDRQEPSSRPPLLRWTLLPHCPITLVIHPQSEDNGEDSADWIHYRDARACSSTNKVETHL